MEQPAKYSWASAYQNEQLIWIYTDSGRGMCVYDPQGKEAVLKIHADDKALGEAVKEALACSRLLPPEEAREFLDHRRAEQVYDRRIESLVHDHGYKNKYALLKRMKRCSIEMFKEMITIAPSVHESLESWAREKSDGLEEVIVEACRPASEIGAALRLAFSRCVE